MGTAIRILASAAQADILVSDLDPSTDLDDAFELYRTVAPEAERFSSGEDELPTRDAFVEKVETHRRIEGATLVAKHSGRLVGLTFSEPHAFDDGAWVGPTLVSAESRNLGVATALKAAITTWSSEHHISFNATHVDIANGAMIAANRKVGYRPLQYVQLTAPAKIATSV